VGLFDFLKSKEKSASVSISHEKELLDYRKSIGNFIHIDKLNFHGQHHQSDNGRFIIAWSDFDPKSRISGFRKSGYGSYVLLDEGKIILHGELERPNDGKVSNQGVFILNDWMFSECLNGTFYAFNVEGQKLIEHKCEANLLNNGLSEDGEYAVCQTANNLQGDDGNKLFFFNLKEQELVWKHTPETGWTKEYSFDKKQMMLGLTYGNKCFRYSFVNGTFIDSDLWKKERINFANGYQLLVIAEEKKKHLELINADLQGYDEVIKLLKRALEKGVSENTQARIYRIIGDIHYMRGENVKAIEDFEAAIKLNPDIGVKKLLKKLRCDGEL
jgi:tetratricopeptide (TPR) repeat protein